MIQVSGYAFPSGHALAAATCWFMIAVLLGFGRARWVKVTLWVAAFAIAALVGLSRIYLGVHWWTDVIGGFALAGLWLSVLGLAMLSRRFAVRPSRTSG